MCFKPEKEYNLFCFFLLQKQQIKHKFNFVKHNEVCPVPKEQRNPILLDFYFFKD